MANDEASSIPPNLNDGDVGENEDSGVSDSVGSNEVLEAVDATMLQEAALNLACVDVELIANFAILSSSETAAFLRSLLEHHGLPTDIIRQIAQFAIMSHEEKAAIVRKKYEEEAAIVRKKLLARLQTEARDMAERSLPYIAALLVEISAELEALGMDGTWVEDIIDGFCSYLPTAEQIAHAQVLVHEKWEHVQTLSAAFALISPLNLLDKLLRDFLQLRVRVNLKDPGNREDFQDAITAAYKTELNKTQWAQIMLAYAKDRTNLEHGFKSNNRIATEKRRNTRPRVPA